MITFNGGITYPTRTGDTRPDQRAPFKEKRTILWSKLHTETPKPMPNGPTSDCPPKRNGSSLRVEDWLGSPLFGARNSGLTENGWRTRIKAIFQSKTPAAMDLSGWLRSPSSRPTDMVSTTWLEMFGSGPRTGIDLTTTACWPRQEEWRAIRKDPRLPSILRNRLRRKKCIAEDHFCAPTSIVPATWWEHAVWAK